MSDYLLLSIHNSNSNSILGPTGKSYSFDSRAEGYGRGEGVATLIIKRLSDALRDGDPVRAVIKATALNQDGKTPTITSPSQEAQENLIRQAYEKCGLDPKDTVYVEAHGTGTQTGDGCEFLALSNVFTPGRSPNIPLYIGSLKANVGHLECASGIAAVIKGVLVLEHGVIPPCANFEHANPQFDFENVALHIPRVPTPWPTGVPRRVSVNNFGEMLKYVVLTLRFLLTFDLFSPGYGGTNAHVILETSEQAANGANSMSVAREHGLTNQLPTAEFSEFSDESTTKEAHSRIFVVSAKDEDTARLMRTQLAAYVSKALDADPQFLDRLAYTLSARRTRFNWVSAMSASTLPQLQAALESSDGKPRLVRRIPRIGFVFNGYVGGHEHLAVENSPLTCMLDRQPGCPVVRHGPRTDRNISSFHDGPTKGGTVLAGIGSCMVAAGRTDSC